MTLNRKAHLRVGVASILALLALLLVGVTRGHASSEPASSPAIATPTPTPQGGQQQQIEPRRFRHRGGGFGGGGFGGGPGDGGAAPAAPSTSGGQTI